MLIAGALSVIGLCTAPAAAQHGAANGEWRSYGGDTGSTKYSPLDQVTADNFEQLEIAWRWRSVDTHLARSAGGGSWLAPARELFEVLAQEDPDRWDTEIYSPRPGTSLLICHAAHGGRHSVPEHAALSGRGGRRADGRDALVIRPEGVRVRARRR